MTGLEIFKRDFRLEKSLLSYAKQLKPGQKFAVKGQNASKTENVDAIKSSIVEKGLDVLSENNPVEAFALIVLSNPPF